MKKSLVPWMICLLLVLLFALSACGDDDENNTPTDTGTANMLAREGMERMNEVVIELDETAPEINDQNDLMLEATFNEIQAKFDEALTYDANNPMANLGLAILSIVSINYDAELWNLYDDMNALDHSGKRIINNQFQFMAQTPVLMMTQFCKEKSDPVSMMRLQNYVKTAVLPRIDTAVSRLSHAVAMADSTTIQYDTGEEYMEIDCGEIYAFRSAVYAVQAAFNMMVAYNMDMVGLDGTYDYIEEAINLEAPYIAPNEVFDYHMEGTTLVLDKWVDWYEDTWEEAHRSEILQKVLCHNFTNNNNFSVLTDPARLAAAKAALLNSLNDIITGSDYILAESDQQSDDVIKIENIVSFNDEDLPPDDEDGPNFVQDWDTITDVCNWFQNFLTGSVAMYENDVNFTVNASAFFNGGIQKLKDYVPYFHWNNLNDDWISPDFDYSYFWNATSYTFIYQGESITQENLTGVLFREYEMDCSMGYLTDNTGAELPEGEVAYLPDYTFNGVLPGMTRAKFIQLVD